MIKFLSHYCLFGILFFNGFQFLEAQSVTSFTLINATTDVEIGQLSEGDIINLWELNGDALNVNANTNPSTVGSVKFILQGTPFRTENVAPYALAGNSGTNYADWRPIPGEYVLEAIPYAQSKGQGTAGTSLTVNFTVVNQEPIATVPAAPSQLSVSADQPGVAVLQWEDNATNETSFLIEFTNDFGGSDDWELLTTLASNSTSYTDNTLDEQGYRYYRVAAVNEVGSSDFSQAVQVANFPYPPTDIVVSNVTTNSFDMRWTEPPYGNDYQIDIAPSEDGDYEYFDAFYFGYTDFGYSGFEPGTTYYFRMQTNFSSLSSDWTYFTVTTLSDPQSELPAVVRINAGGPEVSYGDSVFVADEYFSGDGKSYTNSSITDIANTTQDELYLTERSTNKSLQSFSYAIPVTNGAYEIKLHFAEIYFGATGGGSGGSNKRVFSAKLEGEPVLVDYDINDEVGAMTATVKIFSTQVDDQKLNLTFSASVNQPKLSALEVYGEGSLINDSSVPAVVRINAGGSEVNYGDSVFVADTYFSGNGKSYSNSNITNIANTTQDELYLSERSTNQSLQSFDYNIPLTNGDYEVRLHFAEIYFGATGGGSGGSNKRVFSVTAEGAPILANYDINAQVGPMTAVIETFTVSVTDETLNLNFSASVNQPKVSAIEIYGEGSLRDEPTACGWNDLAGSSLAKVEAQSAKVNGKLYVLAGFMAGLKITGATEIYDPATDSWSLGAPMPTPVTHMGATAIGDEIWIVAGFVGNHPGAATDLVQVYNTTTDTWRQGPALPNPRGSGASAYANGKLHFFGGLLPDRRTDV
ncbi:MAG: malectin domain-containing carbohydrate-binding protein, partial [Tunicatimonas sp.]|uniref:malectin domain-containing carbohydrate-binding protein n=1 Tax=Tunicatimonas sp. TaxID=1940096 RepID=UPI003C769758